MSKTVRAEAGTITVRVLLSFQKRGGRRLVVAPDGGTSLLAHRIRIDSTLVKAIARAHRWKRLLETGEFSSAADLAKVEKINKSYLCRMLRLTLLAPDIVEAIMDGRWPGTLPRLMKPFPIMWAEQRAGISR
jgi:hypothetical protein